MNQRLWIVVALVLPLLFGGWAVISSRSVRGFGPEWQPQKLVSFYQETESVNPEIVLHASRDWVCSDHYAFDLKTRQSSYNLYGNIADDENATWDLSEDGEGALHLNVTRDGKTSRYDVPASLEQTLRAAMKDQASVRFYAWDNTVALLTNAQLYRWKRNRPTLQKALKISATGKGSGVVDVKSQTVIYADINDVKHLSALDGHLIKRVVPAMSDDAQWLMLSASGRYVSYGVPDEGAASRHLRWTIFDASSGRAVWEFEAQDEGTPSFFALADKFFFLAVPPRQIWEVRDGSTGQIIRTLPLVSGTRGGVLSPDGNTLYSLSGGVLYRQRAR